MGAIPTTWSLLASQIAAATAAATSAANSDADAKVQAKLAKQYADGCAQIYAEFIAITLPVPWVARGVWTAGTIYSAGSPPDYVTYNGNGYVCNVNHTSGSTFASDAAYWTLAIDVSTAVTSFFASLPTTLPATNGVVWNNSGYICITTT